MNREKRYYPLTDIQMVMVFMQFGALETGIANISCTLEIKDRDFQMEFLEKAINLLLYKNEGLRLRFVQGDGILLKQYITEYKETKLASIDLGESGDGEEWINQEVKKLFRLIDSDLFYFALIKKSEAEASLFIKINHGIIDGWGMYLVANQIGKYYSELKKENEINQEEKMPSFIDFINQSQEFKKTEAYQKSRMFWREKLRDYQGTSFLRPKDGRVENANAKVKYFKVSTKITKGVFNLCDSLHTYLAMFFIAVIQIYINRTTLEEDILIMSLFHNRLDEIELNTVGMFYSILPFRVTIDDDLDVTRLLKKVESGFKAGISNIRGLPVEDVVDFFKNNNDMQAVVVSYEKYEFCKSKLSDAIHFYDNGIMPCALLFRVHERENQELWLSYEYWSSVFSDEDISQMNQAIEGIISRIIQSQDIKVKECQLKSYSDESGEDCR
jgi:hypothetical protein